MINVNRNTINSDVDFLYSKIIDSTNFIYPENAIITNLSGMEQQKIRIREYLDNYKSLKDKLAIERMLNDVTFRINNTYLKLSDSAQRKFAYIVNEMNNLAEKNHLETKFLTLFDTIIVSPNTQKKIKKLIHEDRHKKT